MPDQDSRDIASGGKVQHSLTLTKDGTVALLPVIDWLERGTVSSLLGSSLRL